MIRERVHLTTRDLAGWNEALAAIAAANAVCERRGWPAARTWTLVAGPFNEIVMETDYEDLAEYERLQSAMAEDEEWHTATHPLGTLMVVDRSYNELLMSAETVG